MKAMSKKILFGVIILMICMCINYSNGETRVSAKTDWGKNSENKEVYTYPITTVDNEYEDSDSLKLFRCDECEEIKPDVFCMSQRFIFINNPVDHNIYVYDEEKHVETIQLRWNMSVKGMYCSDDSNLLKILYEDENMVDDTHIFLTQVEWGRDKEVEPGMELQRKGKILLEYGFDSKGNVLEGYLGDNEDIKNKLVVNDKIGVGTVIEGDAILYAPRSCKYNDQKILYIGKNKGNLIFATPENDENALEKSSYQMLNNKAYQMCADDKGVHIYELVKKTTESLYDLKSILEEKPYDYEVKRIRDEDNVKGRGLLYAAGNYKTMNKATILSRMKKYLNYSWTFNSKRNAKLSVVGNKDFVTQPSWLKNISDGKDHDVNGIPYCWGGWNAESFLSEINAGKYAGNVHTKKHQYVSGTVGMDCAGYVSVAFDLPEKHGTGMLENCFKRIYSDSARSCDILLISGEHVKMIGDVVIENGVQYVFTYEESKTAGRSKHSKEKLNTLTNKGYVLRRYKYLA